MYGSEYICHLVRDAALEGTYHGEYIICGDDVDETTCHVIVKTLTNECAVLIEVLQRLQPFGCTIVALHRLRGHYTGCLEIDLQLMARSPRKRRNTAPYSQQEV